MQLKSSLASFLAKEAAPEAILTMVNGLKIIPLADASKHIPVLADWFVDEWAPYYGAEGPGNALDDLTACSNRDALPLAVVALGDGDVLVGTAALKLDSVGSEMAPGPWLSAFLVHPDHRRQGTGNRLVEAIEAIAVQLELDAIYVSTDAAKTIFKRRGWERIGKAQSLRGETTVYRLQLI